MTSFSITNDIAAFKTKRILMLILRLHQERMTLRKIAAEFNICNRTAFRYLNLLDSMGFKTSRDIGGRYFIKNDGSCPICNKRFEYATTFRLSKASN